MFEITEKLEDQSTEIIVNNKDNELCFTLTNKQNTQKL